MITEKSAYVHLFEHSPWVVERAFAKAPFPDKPALHKALMQVVENAFPDEQLALIRAHPELAAKTVPLTEASHAEQKGAGLKSLSSEEFARFSKLNASYREKFGFPFIICVRMHHKASILEQFEVRLKHDIDKEMTKALQEIGHITRLRLEDIS